MTLQLILSEDGSHTLYNPELNEHYHSVHGAVQESMHVFINAGLMACGKKQFSILEIGFGTGLNALLTFIETEAHGLKINYTSYEPFPLTADMWQRLNHPQIFMQQKFEEAFHLLHASEWGRRVVLSDRFELHKIDKKIEQADLSDCRFDVIYFDAFAPAVQPELWTFTIFKKLYEATAIGGMLVTYSAMGEVRRNLIKAGYKIERLPGPPGKREMLRATKIM